MTVHHLPGSDELSNWFTKNKDNGKNDYVLALWLGQKIRTLCLGKSTSSLLSDDIWLLPSQNLSSGENTRQGAESLRTLPLTVTAWMSLKVLLWLSPEVPALLISTCFYPGERPWTKEQTAWLCLGSWPKETVISAVSHIHRCLFVCFPQKVTQYEPCKHLEYTEIMGNVSTWASQIRKRIKSQIKELRYSIVGIKTPLHFFNCGSKLIYAI